MKGIYCKVHKSRNSISLSLLFSFFVSQLHIPPPPPPRSLSLSLFPLQACFLPFTPFSSFYITSILTSFSRICHISTWIIMSLIRFEIHYFPVAVQIIGYNNWIDFMHYLYNMDWPWGRYHIIFPKQDSYCPESKTRAIWVLWGKYMWYLPKVSKSILLLLSKSDI